MTQILCLLEYSKISLFYNTQCSQVTHIASSIQRLTWLLLEVPQNVRFAFSTPKCCPHRKAFSYTGCSGRLLYIVTEHCTTSNLFSMLKNHVFQIDGSRQQILWNFLLLLQSWRHCEEYFLSEYVQLLIAGLFWFTRDLRCNLTTGNYSVGHFYWKDASRLERSPC